MKALSAKTLAGIEFAADLIRQAKYAVALTGAGISTPSGIPDFRSAGSGLWSKDEPLETASLHTFRVKPEAFFHWLRPLAGQMAAAQPNAAHLALAQLEQRGFIKAVITQNIDVLHQKAGSQNVVETHGSMKTLTCTQCYYKTDAAPYIEALVEKGDMPRCPKCGSVLKPDVILFGEQLPQKAWSAAQKEARQCDLMIVAGSSLEVLPVAGLPMQTLDRGGHLIIVNNDPTYINVRADAAILDDVAEVLPAIAEKVLNG
ncbi:MAG: NAD-dependent deacylase [Anaerolineales bacterium]|nr:NAD-dependent deacylase [Anaerolineales bacterium]